MRVLLFISRNLALLTLTGATAAFLYPPAFLIFANWFLWFFAVTMFALGLVLDPIEFRRTLKRPGRILLGVFSQYTIMPAVGLAAAYLSGFDKELALGFILVGCAPGAMASNVIVFLAGGATAYSVALTTVSTFLSPLLTPTLVEFLGGVFLPIPFWPMLRTIVLIVALPLALGMALRPFTAGFRPLLGGLAPATAVVAIVVICSYAVASNQALIAGMGPSVMLWVIGINAIGYALGWLSASLYGFEQRYRIALTIEIGMQNAGLGVALALEHFGPSTALPGALFAVWCIITAAAATSYLRRRSTPPASSAVTEPRFPTRNRAGH
jgi:bile acid:Na+ symporter, BASS family